MALYPLGGGGGSSGVTQLVAGTGISISPAGGTGNVTVNQTTYTLTDGQDFIAFADDDTHSAFELADNPGGGSNIYFGGQVSPGFNNRFQVSQQAGAVFVVNDAQGGTFIGLTDGGTGNSKDNTTQFLTGSVVFELGDAKTFIIEDDSAAALLTITDGGAGASTAAWTIDQTTHNINPVTDATYALGTSALRWHGAVADGNGFSIYQSASDANRAAYLTYNGGGQVAFGNGGASALTSQLGYWATQVLGFANYQAGSRSLGINTNTGIIETYAKIVTAGTGVGPIYAVGTMGVYTNAAPTTLSYTPPALAGVYRITGTLNQTVATTLTFRVKIGYHDAAGNTVTTDVPLFYLQGSTTLLSGGPAANTTGHYVMFPYIVAVDNSGSAITIGNNAGTYTTGTYYWVPIIEQEA